MLHQLPQGATGGDFNSIIIISDSKKNSQSKMSPSCRNLVNAFSWIDSFGRLHPKTIQFSRYQNTDADGATRIDRSYQGGDIIAKESQYHSISFCDHLCLRVSYDLPHKLDRHLAPYSKPSYKISPSVVKDDIFKDRLRSSMQEWLRVKEAGADLMVWWDSMFKSAVKNLAIQHGKEMKKERLGILNMLKLKQAYFTTQVPNNVLNSLTELLVINGRIAEWYKSKSEIFFLMSRSENLAQSEKVRIFHHSQHQTFRKRSSILKLKTPQGLVSGHDECAAALESNVADHLLNHANLLPQAQEILLKDFKQSFSEDNNNN